MPDLAQPRKRSIVTRPNSIERVWSGWVWSGRETIDVHINTACLNNLQVMEVLPLYRCIRPNELKSPDQFQTDKVLVQLRYTGVLETTRIRKEV